ncbi:unnamed protein product [Lota lota]
MLPCYHGHGTCYHGHGPATMAMDLLPATMAMDLLPATMAMAPATMAMDLLPCYHATCYHGHGSRCYGRFNRETYWIDLKKIYIFCRVFLTFQKKELNTSNPSDF